MSSRSHPKGATQGKPAVRDSRRARGQATCAKLVAIAEKLFAERGIEGVSLNDINKAAGQRNKNATHYHFGSKLGLLQAILDKHDPAITARQMQLLDEAEGRGDATLRDVVRALIQPFAEKLRDPDGGRHYIRLNAQLVITHTMAALDLKKSPLRIGRPDRFTAALRKVTPRLPDSLSHQRGLLMAVLMMQTLAEHARILESGDRSDVADTALFMSNLEDCLVAMLSAPPSHESLALCRTG